MVPPPDSGQQLPPFDRSGQPPEVREAMQDWEIAALRREVTDLKECLDQLTSEKEKAMRWGIMALGGAVLGMGTWIFNFIFSHITTK